MPSKTIVGIPLVESDFDQLRRAKGKGSSPVAPEARAQTSIVFFDLGSRQESLDAGSAEFGVEQERKRIRAKVRAGREELRALGDLLGECRDQEKLLELPVRVNRKGIPPIYCF
jgi:hypothetical protein